jgi:putative transcriptional regulator
MEATSRGKLSLSKYNTYRSRTLANALTWLALFLLITQANPVTPSPALQTEVGLKGKLLVAKASIGDPRFSKTVIYMIDHSSDGAMGLVVNRVAGEIPFNNLLNNIMINPPPDTGDLPVYYGGPVQMNRVFLLHSTEVMPERSTEVSKGIAFSTDPRLIKNIARGNGPDEYRFIFGYAGWAPDQLEAEIERGDWEIVEAEAALVFSHDPEETWGQLMEGKVFRL